jgi:hypothetical protein
VLTTQDWVSYYTQTIYNRTWQTVSAPKVSVGDVRGDIPRWSLSGNMYWKMTTMRDSVTPGKQKCSEST